jgi:DNA-binding GntR family transcriptional regulator
MSDYRKTPLFKKAEEIRELAEAIVESAPDLSGEAEDRFEASMMEGSKNDIMANAYLIRAKIAGAYNMDLYDLQMENACLIRRACRELIVALRGLEMAGHKEEAHFDLLRKAVDEFRPLFVEWVATFKESDRMWDDWGLFNLPGDVPDND